MSGVSSTNFLLIHAELVGEAGTFKGIEHTAYAADPAPPQRGKSLT